MALKLSHLHIKTKTPDETVKFYVENLGATITSQGPKGGYHLDLHGLPLNISTFHANQTRQQTYGIEHIDVETDDYDAHLAMLKGKGVKILEEITNPGKRECFFEGPDGVQVDLSEMKQGARD